MVDFTSPMWKDSLRFVEPNLSGIGGLHLVPTCEQIMADVVLPGLAGRRRRLLHLRSGHDMRELLMQEAARPPGGHRPAGPHLCFVEPKYAGSGPGRAGGAWRGTSTTATA